MKNIDVLYRSDRIDLIDGLHRFKRQSLSSDAGIDGRLEKANEKAKERKEKVRPKRVGSLGQLDVAVDVTVSRARVHPVAAALSRI